jgi:hypothetical protein
MVEQANTIIEEYTASGYDLTLRQLYYQFVARGLIENSVRSYKKLGVVVSDGRLAGLIDWEAIVDRTRNLMGSSHWDKPEDIIASAADGFRLDRWSTQPCYVEVWIEKEALAGVLQACCPDLDVSYFSCKGYVSQSEQWRAARRLGYAVRAGQTAVIVHLGDHDPSGIDMTRDIRERINDTFGSTVEVDRVALNMDQVDEHKPPPNPAKITDSRFDSYAKRFGTESWELDALEPSVLIRTIRKAVLARRNERLWKLRVREENEHKEVLRGISENYEAVTEYVAGLEQ